MKDNQLICDECEKGPFKTPGALKQHKTIMHGRKRRPKVKAHRVRRKYRRRAHLTNGNTPMFPVNYCPVCRCDLRAVGTALQFSRAHETQAS